MRLIAHAAVFTIIAPGAVAVVAPALIVWATGAPPGGAFSLGAGAALVAAGAAIYGWCLYDFISAGRGTPAPYRPPSRLVVRGLYRVVRNPMYVGVTAAVVGEALAFRSALLLAYGIAVLIAFHLRVMYYEEPTLEGQFGAAWKDYRDRVPRWIPRVFPRRAGRRG